MIGLWSLCEGLWSAVGIGVVVRASGSNIPAAFIGTGRRGHAPPCGCGGPGAGGLAGQRGQEGDVSTIQVGHSPRISLLYRPPSPPYGTRPPCETPFPGTKSASVTQNSASPASASPTHSQPSTKPSPQSFVSLSSPTSAAYVVSHDRSPCTLLPSSDCFPLPLSSDVSSKYVSLRWRMSLTCFVCRWSGYNG